MPQFLFKAIILAFASAIQGAAMSIFLFPHCIPSGGAAGIGVLLNHVWAVPHATSIWLLNVVMVILAVKWLGKSNAVWTIFCVGAAAFTIHSLSPYIHHPIENVWIDLVIGALLFGFSVGILFKMGASSGGMDILALIISSFIKRPPGSILFWINSLILLVAGVVIDWKVIMYALICQWIGTRLIDIIGKGTVSIPVLKK
ncbi:YitT family protein [Priestia abyssalis]|uniref:YitT family protein n=1 Tax=Priestia abyssalis TaxID=1221450 RepID=UPI000994EAA9|nr:YitT family protein [Priestia abyssalis]